MTFTKILIANRAEIACRVIRTARNLGYQTVAVFSDADRDGPHVQQADEAVHLGGSAVAESYLSIPKLVDAARKTGAGAIHPGYGFLSENAAFAQACADAGLVFIGPPASAIEAMGDKAKAKRRMIAAGVPCAPGYLGEVQDDARLIDEAGKLGFPLLVKAVAGGGGRGMRMVRGAGELAEAIAGARRESLSAFGDGTLMLEHLIEDGRHIEIQVFADAHGNAVYLGERDCTAQRRRQKVIEEAPSAIVNPAMREAMGRDAVAAALAVGYRGAGTVEFVVDQKLQHYFLEMNTRLQVEHPVTEMVTGFDLVAWQIKVARGDVLPARQEQITLSGHAIEARLYAEDPYAGFAPQTGSVAWWRPQGALAGSSHIRIDDGIDEGAAITSHYDPMVAKIIVHGETRPDAIRLLQSALARAPLLGMRNNGKFLSDLVGSEAFRSATMTTTLLDQWLEKGEAILQRPIPDDAAWRLAAAVFALREGAGWRPNSVAAFDVHLLCDGTARTLRVETDRTGRARVSLGGEALDVRLSGLPQTGKGELRWELDGVQRGALVAFVSRDLHLHVQGNSFVFAESSPFPDARAALDPRRSSAPVAGRVTQVRVAAGVMVQEGDQLVCIEAMKMEMWVAAGVSGTVGGVHVKVGDQVELGALLVELEK
jgi:geranyl-CoA carboxylase alpha subunit